MNTTPFRELEAEAIKNMTPTERVESDTALQEEERKLTRASKLFQ